MNRINFQQPDGFPLKSETLGFMQTAYTTALHGLAQLAGNANVIVSGCIDSGTTVSDGWVWFDSELFFFEGGLKSANFVVIQEIETDTNENGNVVERYFTRRLRFGSGTNQYAFSSLQRVESLLSLTNKIALSYIENAVILGGCSVSNVTATTVTINAGVAVISGKFLNVSAYTGVFPAYFTEGNVWETVQPTTVNYLTFDPYSSNYLQFVNKRAATLSGEILMQIVDLTQFDASGLGRWKYAGFALCNGDNGTFDMRGRVPMGYDSRTADPNNGNWDSRYNNLGDMFGEKEHTLTIQEMPRHNHQPNDGGDPNGAVYQPALAGGYALIQKTSVGQNRVAADLTTTGSGTKPDVVATPALIPFQGQDEAHENRPPFIVLAYIQRL